MRYLSVCAGIEAATVAWHPLGWEAAAFSDIDAFPRAVLRHHYPETPLHGRDRRKGETLEEYAAEAGFQTIEGNEYGPIDLLVGGTPCQSFSIAGLRRGLDDDRGNLALEYIRLAERTRARWVVWENVPGVFSSSEGEDFRAFLSGLVRWDVPIPAGGWKNAGIIQQGPDERAFGVAWRVLDAQFAGVPQRRRRVFVVGYIGDWRRAAAVLLERESLLGNPPPRREKGEGITGYTAGSFGAYREGVGTLRANGGDHGGGTETLVASSPDWPAEVAPTLDTHFGDKMGLEDQHIRGGQASSSPPVPQVANPLTARMHKGINTTCDEGQTLIPTHGGGFDEDVTHTLRGEGFDASEDGTGRGTPLVPVAYSIMPMNSGKDFKARETDVAQPIMAGGPVGGNQGGDYLVAPASFAENQKGEVRLSDTTNALTSGGGKPGQGYPAVSYAIQERAVSENLENGPQGKGFQEGTAYTLEARNKVQSVATQMAVRRLTPRECERLQGFPDNYTRIPYRGKPAEDCPDGPRYKALGNSMAVPVMAWIGRRIAMMERIAERLDAGAPDA